MPPHSGAERVKANATDLNFKRFSCLQCRQRKVKCDRRNPCSNCARATAQCSFVPPVRGTRKMERIPKEGLHAKLRRYEEMLKSYGAKIEPSDTDSNNVSDVEAVSVSDVRVLNQDDEPAKKSSSGPFTFDESKTKLISNNGSSRYFDSGLWPNLEDEFNYPTEELISGTLEGSDGWNSDPFQNPTKDSSLVLGGTFVKKEDLTAYLHVPFHILQRLFDKYRDRVDPLLKLLHLPTFWSELTNALENPHEMTKSLEALIFSFYLVAILSLEDDECYSLLGEEKPVIAARYSNSVRQALINADFLRSSSLLTLQAYVMFLLGVKGHHQSNSLYIMSGIAVRLARRMGLQRDGTKLGLSPFETEMRRRLWWHIVHLDWRTCCLSATKPSMDLFLSDTKKPSNIEDDDINPNMINPPPERTSITSVVMCLLRCDLMDFLRSVTPSDSPDVRWTNLSSPSIALAEKDKMIAQMEDMFETKYLRYYDPSNSLHFLSSIVARLSVCKIKLSAHDPRQFSNRGLKVPQRSRDIIFANGTKLLEYANLMHSNQSLRKYGWQMSTVYLWDTLHYVLIEARHRKTGPEVEHVWQLVGAVLWNYPQIFGMATDALSAALGKWTLRVWDDLVAAQKVEGLPESPVPDFITAIRQCQDSRVESAAMSNGKADLERVAGTSSDYSGFQSLRHGGNPNLEVGTMDPYDLPSLLSSDTDLNDWVQWERLLSGQAF